MLKTRTSPVSRRGLSTRHDIECIQADVRNFVLKCVAACIVVCVVSTCGCDEGQQTSSGSASNDAPATDAATTGVTTTAATAGSGDERRSVHARDILGNPDYPAFCYGGYRGKTRDESPSLDELKEDLKILSAMGVKILRTYNTQHYSHAADLLKAINELKGEDASFEMYVMLGAWIECKGAWTKDIDHTTGHVENNTAEIKAAVALTNQYPDIVKVIAVGNEAMVTWAATYYVAPQVILKWVNHLQTLKKSGGLPAEVWVTSSVNFAAWGGESDSYHPENLRSLVAAVDYVSLHTYPFHDTYYTPKFWIAPEKDSQLSRIQKADAAVARAAQRAIDQYESTARYIKSLGIEKPIHIGETGWASTDSSNYGAKGSQAADEYKAAVFYDAMRTWTNSKGISCFYFEAFDEQWKDQHAGGSENHFGLIGLNGEARFVLWDEVDAGMFDGLRRNGNAIRKTLDGNEVELKRRVLAVPTINDLGGLAISTMNTQRTLGEAVAEAKYVILHETFVPSDSNDLSYPSELLKLNVWEGTCAMEMTDKVIRVTTGQGDWWGCALEIQGDGKGENLSPFAAGHLHFEVRGETVSKFQIGFQTGMFKAGDQVNCLASFGRGATYQLKQEWVSYSIPVSELDAEGKADLANVTGLLSFKSDEGRDGKAIEIRNVYWSQD